MSLRLRLIVVAALAVTALVVAALSLRDLARNSRAERESVAASSGALAARALDDVLAQLPPPAPDGLGSMPWRGELRRRAHALLGPVLEVRGGYCFADGTILEEEAESLRHHGPPGRGPGRPPHGRPGSGADGRGFEGRGPPPWDDGAFDRDDGPPDAPGPADGHDPPLDDEAERDAPGAMPGMMPDSIRAALLGACGPSAPREPSALGVDLGGDTVSLSVAESHGGVRAFAMRIVRRDPAGDSDGWSWRLIALALITIALVGVAVDALLAVRRGASGLSRALSTIEEDLRAELPPVSGKEFADVATRIRRVATHLADARERERALERRIAHDHRLASLGRVVAGVAHEVRNPLTGMKLLLDGMARRSLDARSEEDVEVCLAELARLEHLVSSLLGVARSGETGRFVQDIGSLVDERLAVSSDLAKAHDVVLERAGDARVLAVRDVLVRVIDNLVRNAVQASPPGARVRVVVGASADELEIDVQDEGPGVGDAAREELFEPFRTTKADGTGLGLWLSHTALTAQGGMLAHRREGTVTHFIITLPREAT